MTIELARVTTEQVAALHKMDSIVREIIGVEEEPKTRERDDVLWTGKEMASHCWNEATELNKHKDGLEVARLVMQQRGIPQIVNETQLHRFDDNIIRINVKYPTKK